MASSLLREPRTWLAIFSAVAVGVFLTREIALGRSPGPVSAVHGQLEELEGGAACSECHGRVLGSMNEACQRCHEGVGDDFALGHGLHGNLPEEKGDADCADCHFEHHGVDAPPTTRLSFFLAGVPDPEQYDHENLGFELGGRHLEIDCSDCHENARDSLLSEGTPRFRGLEQACSSCHEDVHEGRIVRDCASCHGQVHSFAEVHEFEHESFRDEGAHAELACADCHDPESERSVESMAGVAPPEGERVCGECHESEHRDGFLASVASLRGMGEQATCTLCHDAVHAGFEGYMDVMPRELHAASGFELDRPHEAVACSACHDPEQGHAADFLAAFPGRTQKACEACHADPHEGQFSPELAGQACLECHTEKGFRPSGFGIEDHARTEFPLEGSHEAVACTECHDAFEGETRVFHGTERSCHECHEDSHRGRLAERFVGNCEECHSPSAFADIDREGFDHGGSTAYDLHGAHARADCDACHRKQAPGSQGRTFGFVHEVFGDPVDACATCHDDVHRGEFDRATLPHEIEGRTSCERCHGDESFHELRIEFDHAFWTDYDTGGVHAGLECRACHAFADDAQGRRFLPVKGTDCASCHSDPHVGQFAERGRTDCSRCHSPVGVVDFDHDRDSRFPLDEQHADLECAKCHVPWPLPDGGEAVRYKPLGTECGDCHSPYELDRHEKNGRRK